LANDYNLERISDVLKYMSSEKIKDYVDKLKEWDYIKNNDWKKSWGYSFREMFLMCKILSRDCNNNVRKWFYHVK
jgi:hypothetical protein